MKLLVQYNTMQSLWVLLIDCTGEESPKFFRIVNKIIVRMLFGSILPAYKRRVRFGKHYLVHNVVVEIHSNEWFPLILACKNKEVIEGIRSIFVDIHENSIA